MKYYKLNTHTDWQVMYSPSYMEKDKEYRVQVINELMSSFSVEEAPVIPCKLIHKHEDYRDIVDWKSEGKEPPPVEAPLLKDVIQKSGMLSFNGVGGIIISPKFKNALESHITNKHFFYKFKLEYRGEYHDYYFLLPNTQTSFDHIDFTKTEFLTKPKYGERNRKTRRRELIQASEVMKVADLEEYLEIVNSLEIGVYNKKTLYVNNQFDLFLHEGVYYYVSERFKNFIEKEGLEVTFSELSPASNVSTIIAPEEV